jgi:3D (Asp-Asp-Asp) domain-containing protein
MTHTLAKLAASRISQISAALVVAGLSVGLIGAARFQPAAKAEQVHGAAAAAVVAQETETAEVAAFTMKGERTGELLRDADTTAAPATVVHKIHNVRTIRLQVTAYCPCKRCCGPAAQGLTASGRTIAYNGGHFVAADTRLLPFNTKLIIPGYANDKAVQVIDRGGAIKGNHIDLFFPTHEQAREWGVKWMQVTVLE